MEINARVYAVSTDENLLKQVHRVLSAKTFQHHVFIDPLEPCAVLTLSRTWYGFAERAEPTNGPKYWLETLRECAGLLRRRILQPGRSGR